MRVSFLNALFALACCGFIDEQSDPKPQAPKPDAPAQAAKRLREPGFLFLELTVSDIPGHIAFFRDVGGYKVVRQEEGFVILQTEHGELLLSGSNKVREKPAGRIAGVEVGLVVADLDQAHAAAKNSGWRITSGIMKQSWGVRDFRVLSPDGYYLRFTE